MALSAGTPQIAVPTVLRPAALSPMVATPTAHIPSLIMGQVSRPLISAPALALQPTAAKKIVAPLINAAQGEENGGHMFDASVSRQESSLDVAVNGDAALRAKVEADISAVRSNTGYLGYSIDPGEPGHPNPSMQVRHVLIRMKHPDYITTPNSAIVYRAAGLPVIYDFADHGDIRTMGVTLAKASPKSSKNKASHKSSAQ
jgi:hypothetical protein